MDNEASNIEICRQCQHKDCRYCRFNPKDADKPTPDKPHDNELLIVESAISILRRKADEFEDKASCKSCPLKNECWESVLACRTMFLKRVLSGYIDVDGNLIFRKNVQKE